MPKKISFLINTIIVFLLTFNCLVALELTIIPQKKPVLDKAIKEKKISQNIIKPQKKPVLDKAIKEKKVSKNIIKPLKKPIKEVTTEIEQVVEIKKEKISNLDMNEKKIVWTLPYRWV